MRKKRLKNNKYIKIFLLILLLIGIIILIYPKKKHFETISINFSSRLENLEQYDTKGITKYGWLQIQGTNIDLPIISSSFYGDLDFDYGWISANSIDAKTRKVILGHNVLNVSSTPMVNSNTSSDFEDLMAFVYYDFAKENMYLSYTEDGKDKIFVIYGIGFYDYGYDNAEGLNTTDEIKSYIKKVKENSIYKYNVNVNENDNLITIKTCTRYFGVEEKQQFVIDARELRENEETLKYTVKKTKLYTQYNLKDTYELSTNEL